MIRLVWCGLGLCILLFMMSDVGEAQDAAVVDIFKDGFYGGLAGTLVGTAALAFAHGKTKDHLNYIAIGAGVGVIAGTTYGIYSASRAVAELEGSRVTWHLPVPQIARKDIYATAAMGWKNEYSLTLLRVHF